LAYNPKLKFCCFKLKNVILFYSIFQFALIIFEFYAFKFIGHYIKARRYNYIDYCYLFHNHDNDYCYYYLLLKNLEDTLIISMIINSIAGLFFIFWFIKKCKNKINLTIAVHIVLIGDIICCILMIFTSIDRNIFWK
jgi:hypothetical protein